MSSGASVRDRRGSGLRFPPYKSPFNTIQSRLLGTYHYDRLGGWLLDQELSRPYKSCTAAPAPPLPPPSPPQPSRRAHRGSPPPILLRYSGCPGTGSVRHSPQLARQHDDDDGVTDGKTCRHGHGHGHGHGTWALAQSLWHSPLGVGCLLVRLVCRGHSFNAVGGVRAVHTRHLRLPRYHPKRQNARRVDTVAPVRNDRNGNTQRVHNHTSRTGHRDVESRVQVHRAGEGVRRDANGTRTTRGGTWNQQTAVVHKPGGTPGGVEKTPRRIRYPGQLRATEGNRNHDHHHNHHNRTCYNNHNCRASTGTSTCTCTCTCTTAGRISATCNTVWKAFLA